MIKNVLSRRNTLRTKEGSDLIFLIKNNLLLYSIIFLDTIFLSLDYNMVLKLKLQSHLYKY